MINFHIENIAIKIQHKLKLKNWLKSIITSEGFSLGEINYIFCSDDYLLKINIEYLDHDYFTDIITFDNSLEESLIEGDIFISIDRVKENALTYEVSFEHELKRVLAHGILHLCGFFDKTPEEEKLMRSKENHYLQQFS
ncbi:rRNA maturation RNase YbeY [Emticicia sp. BO119]|uniref:rRNA maturation RNase YbeY n=1 Tax=Emticicia sp. BO119 TaxID=2757768 RepID=UPI0015EFEA1A|nr:rRNA maturation RNase YbeY [Emticicia sp. BO119]MBA4850028.1 rRNA maturation RNase YbeY [Emticicia sp. BO119]